MNNKVLSVVLVLGIASTGFAGISAASSGSTLSQTKSEIQQRFGGQKEKRGYDGFGKRAGFGHLTEEEKASLETMSDEEKQAFFAAKKSEMEAQKTAHKAVIDALIAGQSLTADQEAMRLEMLAKMQDDTHPRRDGGDIIEKLLAGDELTDDEQAELIKMQELHASREAEKAKIDAMSETEREAYFAAKKAEMEAKMETLKPIFEKKKAGEALTADEQAQLDAFHAEYPMMKRGKG